MKFHSYKIILILSFIVLISFAFAQKKPIAKPEEPVRGVWLTNVASNALLNRKNISNAVMLCKKNGINHIFVVVWNGGFTMYPSKVVESYIGIKQDTVYKGFDPIAELIAIAHRAKIKVHAWFEFGFSYAYKDTNSLWLKKYPHWAAKNNEKKLLEKNGFYWWSPMHPEVQGFMKKLVLEVVNNYDVDGIQGDDRLPAMPSEGGYDDYTVALYKKETGKEPPADYKEANWLNWKANQLSSIARTLYKEVKTVKPKCIVSWAPSIYPWSKEEYLQNWPAWLDGGYADYIFPQLYRYDYNAYSKILNELLTHITAEQKSKVYPGVLAALGDGYLIKPDLLQKMIEANRRNGFKGECFFYFEFLRKVDKVY